MPIKITGSFTGRNKRSVREIGRIITLQKRTEVSDRGEYRRISGREKHAKEASEAEQNLDRIKVTVERLVRTMNLEK